ncbi:HEPN domain-containing protein [Cryptosporangium sp. NPDC051539]|uniref:ApeA N-terminal domain 1-containing protein n=1 Tax=Cryptosporangium sp. NPDC051539 TaxID=3363962 RepID=UPI0037B31510
MERLDVEGEFWTAENPSRRVSGTLTFDEKTGGRLSLIGSFDSFPPASRSSESGNYRRIFGHAESGPYTLEDSFQTRWLMGSHGGREVLRVGKIIKGAELTSTGQFAVGHLSVRLDGLVYWANRSGIQDRSAGHSPAFTVESLPSERIDTAWGRLELGQTWSQTGDHRAEVRVTQDFVFSLVFDQLTPFKDAVEIASDLQDLVSIATDSTAGFRQVSFRHPELFQLVDDDPIPISGEVFVQWIARSCEDSRTSRRRMLFTIDDLGGMPGVQRWLETAQKHRSALGRVMAMRYLPSAFSEDRAGNRFMALEGFHKDRSAGPGQFTYVKRLLALANLAGDPFVRLVGDVDAWCKRIRSARNDIAHHNGRRLYEQEGNLYYLGESAYFLFVICMLRDSGAPEVVFEKIEKSGVYGWLRSELAATIPRQT